MAKLIDEDALVAEINQRIIDAPINYIGHQRVWAYNDVKDIINTFDVKEVGLESEMDKYFGTMEVLEHENIFEVTFQRIAKHFFALGLKANNPVTSADRGTAEEIIINLKKIESDYNVCLTKEIEWVRKQVGQPELNTKQD